MTQEAIPTKKTGTKRYVLVGLLVLAAFFVSYRLAAARSAQSSAPSAAFGAVQAGSAANVSNGDPALGGSGSGSGSGSTPACACCSGGSGSSTPVEGNAKVEGSVQRIAIDLSSGSYNPNVIKLKAGVPAELTFGQGSGCLGQVMSKDLGFYEDLTGGSKTVKLPALETGTYAFSCGMQMVFGSVVVE